MARLARLGAPSITEYGSHLRLNGWFIYPSPGLILRVLPALIPTHGHDLLICRCDILCTFHSPFRTFWYLGSDCNLTSSYDDYAVCMHVGRLSVSYRYSILLRSENIFPLLRCLSVNCGPACLEKMIPLHLTQRSYVHITQSGGAGGRLEDDDALSTFMLCD